MFNSDLSILITNEEAIIWDIDVKNIPYVREIISRCATTRKRPIRWRGEGVRVGYSTLKSDAPNNGTVGRFTRRLFFLKQYDRHFDPKGVYEFGTPSDAVDPLSVKPGVKGKHLICASEKEVYAKNLKIFVM